MSDTDRSAMRAEANRVKLEPEPSTAQSRDMPVSDNLLFFALNNEQITIEGEPQP